MEDVEGTVGKGPEGLRDEVLVVEERDKQTRQEGDSRNGPCTKKGLRYRRMSREDTLRGTTTVQKHHSGLRRTSKRSKDVDLSREGVERYRRTRVRRKPQSEVVRGRHTGTRSVTEETQS